MLSKHSSKNKNDYIHPQSGLVEHISTEKEIKEELEKNGFRVQKLLRSHKHINSKGKANKRRTISVYAERI